MTGITESPPTGGLYIHFPFCRAKCPYCHFYSINNLDYLDEFIEGVSKEMGSRARLFSALDTVYIGGGSPSLMTLSHLEKILGAVGRHWRVVEEAEITVEVTPEGLDYKWLTGAGELGVNRLSLGIQSLQAGILSFLRRRHDAADALKALEAVAAAGIVNVSVDLLYGVPGQDLEEWLRDLEKILETSPAHLSLYELTLERGTELWEEHRRGLFAMPGEETAALFFRETSRLLTRAGYEHYEVSSYARGTSRRCRHNLRYWRHEPYLGLGPSAHSFLPPGGRDASPAVGRRWWNVSDVDEYLGRLRSGNFPVEETEELNHRSLAFEALFLALRTSDGLDLEGWRRRYGEENCLLNDRVLEAACGEGLLRREGERILPTTMGLALADRLAVELWGGTA